MPRAHYPWMNPRAAAVSRYRVNKVGKTGRICAIFERSFSIWSGVFPRVGIRRFSASRNQTAIRLQAERLSHDPKTQKKAGVKAGLLQVMSSRSVARDDRAAEVEAIIDADLQRVLVIVEAAERHQHGGGHEAGVAEIIVLILALGRPVLGD